MDPHRGASSDIDVQESWDDDNYDLDLHGYRGSRDVFVQECWDGDDQDMFSLGLSFTMTASTSHLDLSRLHVSDQSVTYLYVLDRFVTSIYVSD